MKKHVGLENIEISKSTLGELTSIPIFFAWIITLLYKFVLQKAISQFYPIPPLGSNIFAILVGSSILLICLGALLDYLNQTELKIKCRELLLIHKLYLLDPRDEEKKRTQNSAYFKFKKTKGQLEIWFYPNGFQVAKKADDLDKILESKFSMFVMETDTSRPEFVYYRLSDRLESERLNATREFL